jgi:acyl carrier protein
MEGVRDAVRTFLHENYLPGEGPESLADDQDLQESGVLDSLGMLKFISFLEEHFGVEFLPEELGSGQYTVNGFSSLVGTKLRAQG